MNQPTSTPIAKVQAAGASGAVAFLLVFIAGQFGLDVPPEAAAALATVLAFAGGYLKRETSPVPPYTDAPAWKREEGYGLVEVAVGLLVLFIALAILVRYVL